MGRGPCTFKKQDVTRAVEALIAAGIEVQKVEIDRDGKITATIAMPQEAKVNSTGNPWDEVPQHGLDQA
jgi:hypothetical protein